MYLYYKVRPAKSYIYRLLSIDKSLGNFIVRETFYSTSTLNLFTSALGLFGMYDSEYDTTSYTIET